MGKRRSYIPRDATPEQELKLIADWLYTDCERWIQMAIDNKGIRDDLRRRMEQAHRPNDPHGNGLVLTLRQQ